MDLLDYIKEKANSPEQQRFKMWTYFNYHLSLYQDFNGLNMQLNISHSNDDEHNWLIHIHLLFWGIEYSWNSRREGKNSNTCENNALLPDVSDYVCPKCESTQVLDWVYDDELYCNDCEHRWAN